MICTKEGKMDEKKILDYVIPLAKDGFEVDSELERSLKLYGRDIDHNSPFYKGNKSVREGDIVKQDKLANTTKIKIKVLITSMKILVKVFQNN